MYICNYVFGVEAVLQLGELLVDLSCQFAAEDKVP